MNKHTVLSYIKSGLRIAAYCVLASVAPGAALLLFVAEVFGIIEEFGQ